MGKVRKRRNRQLKKEMLSQLKKNTDGVRLVGFDDLTREEVIDEWFMRTKDEHGLGVYELLKKMSYTKETHVIVLVDEIGWDIDSVYLDEMWDELSPFVSGKTLMMIPCIFRGNRNVVSDLSGDSLNMVSV